MIKNLLIIVCLLFAGTCTYAQAPRRAQALPPPLQLREVSGVIKDTTDNTVIGAVITLVSKKDTIRTASNVDGVFVLKNVKLATFVLTVTSIGYAPTTRKYLNSDIAKHIVLDPIVMRKSSRLLKEVTIDGTPSITYKTDTVEYKASDYKVRANSTVDELLKKMEGMEVGSDGSVTHQGQAITKAKLNGKDYAGGNLAQAIQNLPADIVDKIQVVDDYGDQAARTGVKDGDPQKVLNITTRADRSVGITGRIIGQYGNDDRYNARVFVQRINGNQQIGLIGNLANTVNGVASSGIAGGATNGGGGGTGVGAGARGSSTPGTTKSGGPSINYRDQWSKKIQVVFGYSYNFTNNNSIDSTYGQRYSTHGSSNFATHSLSQRNAINNNLSFELDFNIDSANYLQIGSSYSPFVSYSSSSGSSNSYNNTVNFFDRVPNSVPAVYANLQHPVTTGFNSNSNSAPNFSVPVLYQHIFKKARRNISFQGTVGRSTTQVDGEKNNEYRYYADSTLNFPITGSDSLVHELTNRTSINTTLRGSLTYVEPLGQFANFEFNGQTRRSAYDNTALTDSILNNGQVKHLAYLDNIYNYSFTETRVTFNYRFNGIKWNWSLGTTLVPTNLAGTKLNSGIGANVSTSRNDFRIIPVFRFAYSWSRTERFTLTYTGTNNEPSFTQIQPFIDKTDPNNIVYGNPNLKQSFANSITAQYNNYIANSQLNFSGNINATITDDQISSNIVQTQAPLANGKTKTINNIYYVNENGSHAIVGRYNIAKQLDDRKYNLSLNGNITYNYSVATSNDVEYHNTNWRFDERFGPRINPNENIEINPYIGYDLSRSFTTLKDAMPTSLQTTSLAVDGKMYFLKTYQVNYSVTKSYVTGLTGFNTNPLVINAGFQKEFLAKRNLVFTFDVFDLLHQNNFISQVVTAQGTTNTLSNALSRYFLVGLRLNLQKWSGTPTRNGRKLLRRGDGSFIY
jgi:hypothetical protein